MNQDQEFMAIALEEAQLALEHDDIPVGAVIIHEEKIIARAHNTREKDGDPTAHAEVCALRLAGGALGHWNLSNSTLYVSLEPCPMCAGALVLSRVKEVVYAAQDTKGGAISLGIDILQNTRLNHRVKFRQGPLQEEAGQLLKSFFQEKRKQKKT